VGITMAKGKAELKDIKGDLEDILKTKKRAFEDWE
jgi:hypothetical protein